MRGKITRFFDGQFVLTPDGSRGCDCFCDECDIPEGSVDLAFTFDVAPTMFGMWKATNLKVDTE